MRSMIPRRDPNGSWFSTRFNDPIKTANDPFGWQGKVDLDTKPFTVKAVQHVQQSEYTTIGFYNSERPHTALDKRTPDTADFGQMEIRKAA